MEKHNDTVSSKDLRPKGDLTRLTGERKHVEMQILRLEQALSALQMDANLSGALKPSEGVTDDAAESMAAIEVMMSALQQRKVKLNAQIEGARHKRHDAAQGLQIERERRVQQESDRSMREHVALSKTINDMKLKTIRLRNVSHQNKVGNMWVMNQQRLQANVSELHSQILKRERQQQLKAAEREKAKNERYEEYCKKERERSDRLLRLEELRSAHLSSASAGRRDSSEPERPSRSLVAGIGALRSLRERKDKRSPSVDESPTGDAPPVSPSVALAQKLDKDMAHHETRRRFLEKLKVSQIAAKRGDNELRALRNRDQIGDEALKKIRARIQQSRARDADIEEAKRMQAQHIEESRCEKATRAHDIYQRSKLTSGGYRWSKRAQRLIEGVCSELNMTAEVDGAEGDEEEE